MSATLVRPLPTAGTPVPVPIPTVGPSDGLLARLKRFSVAEYHRFVALGGVTEADRIELLEGYLVTKMSRNPPHDGTLQTLEDVLLGLLPVGWTRRGQKAAELADSVPEPDVAVVRGDPRVYYTRHPTRADIGLVIEVADTSLADDRVDKARIYARAGIVLYWIVNIPDRQVEVYTDPDPTATPPAYRTRTDYRPGDTVPVTLDGVQVGTVAVADVLP